jgi:predicted nucleotidyltransferase
LSEPERRALAAALDGIPHPVFLFGSRVDDAKRGGDIDILILAENISDEERLGLSLRVTARFQTLCDEKIDVVVFDTRRLTDAEQAFLTLITPTQRPLAA